jgi:hypothetical protein
MRHLLCLIKPYLSCNPEVLHRGCMGGRAIIRSFPQVGPFRDAVIAGAAAEAAQIEVVWGGDYLTQYEIRRVLKHDVQWAAVSFGLVRGPAISPAVTPTVPPGPPQPSGLIGSGCGRCCCTPGPAPAPSCFRRGRW